jgi:hypothetical protein
MADRAVWVDEAARLARPVLAALAARRLKELMPCEGVGDER